jgi:ubiquinone/menaquinone biosynthesis C-methylase UbiE
MGGAASVMETVAHCLFDFDPVADVYDRWYETAKGRRLDRAQKSTVLRILKRLPPQHRRATLLDTGCGTGHWSRFFTALGFAVLGVDISTEMIRVARASVCRQCRFEPGDICDLHFSDRSFDVVASMTAIEFSTDAEKAVAEMARCSKPGGSLIVGTLNRLAPINLERVARAEEPYFSARLLSASELRDLLSPYGRVRVLESDENGKYKPMEAQPQNWKQVLTPVKKVPGALIVAAAQRWP